MTNPSEGTGEVRTALRDSASGVDATTARYVLTVSEGVDQGLRVCIDGQAPSRVLVGQSPACTLRLHDPLVSRRHAAFEVTSRGLQVNDLGSTNGTSVNGIHFTQVLLRGGETLQLGNTSLVVARSDDAKPVGLSDAMRFGRMVGGSAQMRRLYPLCEKLAAAEIPVVIEGETGTGKEVLAEALYEASPRAGAPFVVFDCTAVSPTLLESTLFGHERGAFTGAIGRHQGVFEQADGGTLFIDEIGDLELSLQPKLLRAIERGQIQRIGGAQPLSVDVRIIAATRRDLDGEVQAGRFRDDLFFRLAVGRVELPPLRERVGDIPLLTRHFWRTLGGGDRPLPSGMLERFESYRWPGNLRELHNTVARCLALGDVTDVDPTGVTSGASAVDEGDPLARILALQLPLSVARDRLVAEFERRYVQQVLERSGGNVSRAAQASGIARRYFQVLRARYSK
jgi:DNA-binding NtrC family response regulator